MAPGRQQVTAPGSRAGQAGPGQAGTAGTGRAGQAFNRQSSAHRPGRPTGQAQPGAGSGPARAPVRPAHQAPLPGRAASQAAPPRRPSIALASGIPGLAQIVPAFAFSAVGPGLATSRAGPQSTGAAGAAGRAPAGQSGSPGINTSRFRLRIIIQSATQQYTGSVTGWLGRFGLQQVRPPAVTVSGQAGRSSGLDRATGVPARIRANRRAGSSFRFARHRALQVTTGS